MRKNSDHLPRFVYRIFNFVTGKCYIGITIKSRFDKRMREHKLGIGESKKSLIHRSIVYHGVENFSFQIIDDAENKAKAKEKEIFYILAYKSLSTQRGYNLTKGGDNLPPSKRDIVKSVRNRKTRAPNTSVYVGVYKENRNSWIASYGKEYLGRFSTEIEAHYAREAFIQIYDENNLEFALSCVRPKRERASEYPGIIPSRDKKHWIALYSYQGKSLHLGTFDSDSEASNYREKFIAIFNGSNFKECILALNIEFGREKTNILGVRLNRGVKVWEANCTVQRKSYYIGSFKTPEEASKARVTFLSVFNGSNLEESRLIARNKKSQ